MLFKPKTKMRIFIYIENIRARSIKVLRIFKSQNYKISYMRCKSSLNSLLNLRSNEISIYKVCGMVNVSDYLGSLQYMFLRYESLLSNLGRKLISLKLLTRRGSFCYMKSIVLEKIWIKFCKHQHLR